MNRLKYLFLIFNLCLINCLSCFQTTPIISKNAQEIDDEIEILINKIDREYDIPQISGQISNFPWRNDKDFLKAKEKYNTPLLLAGFCAVLKNPLPGEEYNVKMASENVRGIVIKPSEVFSQNSNLGPYTKGKGYREGATYVGGNIVMDAGGGVCKIATTLYNLSILADLKIVERHNHSMPINYVPYGQDATVAYGVKDFKFKNTTKGNILIWSRLIDNRLYMAFYGTENPPQVTWYHETTDITKPSIKYIKNEELEPGTVNTIIKGLDGATVKSIIQVKYGDGHTAVKNLGISKYIPLPELVEMN